MIRTLTQYSTHGGALETSWTERTYGRHSDTRYLDEPAVLVALILRREGYKPSSTSRQARRAA